MKFFSVESEYKKKNFYVYVYYTNLILVACIYYLWIIIDL